MDKFRLCILWCLAAEGDDQCFLTFQGVDEGLGVIVVYFLDVDGGGEGGGAVVAGEGCYCVFPGGEEGGGYEGA